MTTPRTVVDEDLPITRIVVEGDLNTERVVVDVDDQPRLTVTNTGEDITVSVYSSAAGVNSVNGLQGDVTLTTTNVAEGTNQYFTTARARASFSDGNNIVIVNGVVSTVTEPDFTSVTVTEAPASGLYVTNKTYVDGAVSSAISAINYPVDSVNGQTNTVVLDTDDIGEGTVNLYYTDARADARVDAGIAAIDYPVDSVNGKTNTVVLTTTDIGEGTNLYYTTARANSDFDTRLATKSTTNLAEGTNLYFTTPRARSSISAAGSLSYDSGTGVISYTTPTTIASLSNHDTDDLGEGSTNLYYTNARADARVAIGIANLVDSAPATLDTLNELAAALGDDPNFATTITTALGTKLNTADFTSTADTWLATKSTTNLSEGTNLYYTTARANTDFDTRLATKSTTNLAEGTNLYYTTARANSDFDTRLATKSTTDLSEGTNLYYTTARANSDFDTRLATKTTDNLAEGSTNLYYTDARVLTKINATSIDELSDVVITTAANGQLLYYNGTTWVNSNTVDSPNLSRFTRTATGTTNNAILAVNRNRTDAARATDGGPWLGFEYTGTDNTQATSPQSAIRSMYDSAGNHKLQVLQLPGTYATPSQVAQIQRGNHYFISTTGYNILNITDTTSTTRANVINLNNSANTTTYATFGASAHTIGNIDGPISMVRTSGANTGARPVQFVRNTTTASTTPATGDGASYRLQAAGSNGVSYNLAQISGIYSSIGDTAITFDVANGDQNTSVMSVVRPLESKLSGTTIKATAIPTTTPGGNTLTDVAIFTPDNTYIKSNALTLLNNSGGAFPGGDIAYRRTHGCFHKMATVTAAAANTVYNFDWYTDATAHVGNQGVTVTSGNPTRVNVDTAGSYEFVVEMQAKNDDAADRTAWIWLAKNGNDIAETRLKVQLRAKGGSAVYQTITKVWCVDGLADNDYVEVRFAVDNTSGISLEYEAAQTSPFPMPAQASAVLTVFPIGA